MLENHFNHRQKSLKSFLVVETITGSKAAEDSIIDFLIEETPSWKDIYDVADAGLEKEKSYYAKKKAKWKAEPHGHSLEAVANLRSKLLSEDTFYILKLNDKNMNGKPTFVFKISRVQAKLAIAIDRDNPEAFLNGAYWFADGTFKKCPGSITLSVFVYVGLL